MRDERSSGPIGNQRNGTEDGKKMAYHQHGFGYWEDDMGRLATKRQARVSTSGKSTDLITWGIYRLVKAEDHAGHGLSSGREPGGQGCICEKGGGGALCAGQSPPVLLLVWAKRIYMCPAIPAKAWRGGKNPPGSWGAHSYPQPELQFRLSSVFPSKTPADFESIRYKDNTDPPPRSSWLWIIMCRVGIDRSLVVWKVQMERDCRMDGGRMRAGLMADKVEAWKCGRGNEGAVWCFGREVGWIMLCLVEEGHWRVGSRLLGN
jgi:hypothetical protein